MSAEPSFWEILLSETSADSLLETVPGPHEQRRLDQALETSSAVYHYQQEQLQRLMAEQSTSCFTTTWRRKERKSYIGVRQRQRGKWIAEIRLPLNKTRVWLGTFDSAETAAVAYDIAGYKIRGEYARLNLPKLQLSWGRQKGLIFSVEAKIQAAYQRLNKKKQSKKATRDASWYVLEETKRKMETDCEAETSSFSSTIEPTSSSSMSDGSTVTTWHELLEEVEGECSLESMPVFDSELIWQNLGY